MTDISPTEEAFVVEGLEDWVGLWRFARAIRDRDPDATTDAVRSASVLMARNLVVGGYMRPGHLTKDPPGFSEWTEGPEESVDRIDREWRDLARDPNIPDICWFTNTEKGNRAAREIIARRER